jgi:hypothetical protein
VLLLGELAPRRVQLGLQPGELGHQRLHRGFRVVHQHQADGADHGARLVAQRQPADEEGAGLVGEQVHQDRPAAVDHLRDQRVGDDLLDAMADELRLGLEAQRRQEALVAVADPDHAVVAVHHQHAHRGAREHVEHALRGHLEQAVGVVGQQGRAHWGLHRPVTVAQGPTIATQEEPVG